MAASAMKVALIQFAPRLADVEGTLADLLPLLEQASEADLVVLPELANSGYAFASREHARDAAEDVESGGPFLDALAAFCARRGAHVVTGLNERAGDRLFNSAVVMGPRGVTGHYRKLHLFDTEKNIFEPGDLGPTVCNIGSAVLGLAVCFDWMFPELFRVLALEGAQIIAHPSNLVLEGRCQRATPVHAMINRVFIATANRIGAEGDLVFTGRSLLVAPTGEALAEGSRAGTEILVADVDPHAAQDKQITPRNHALKDRRPEWYGALARPWPPPGDTNPDPGGRFS